MNVEGVSMALQLNHFWRSGELFIFLFRFKGGAAAVLCHCPPITHGTSAPSVIPWIFFLSSG